MAILFCHRPNFTFEALRTSHPEWDALPIALHDDDDIVRACSPEAAASGVHPEQRARIARARCPDVRLLPLDAARLATAHDAFTAVLRTTGLPIEITGPGQGYCDLRSISRSPRDAEPICADLGRQLRRALGEALTPALGCNHGKFTARAAAHVARPGRMRIVDQPDEAAFLAPLPTSLLPLPDGALRQLRWLGIATLADFARLPTSSVVQRWGDAGRIAQQLARGRDPRPVQAPAAALPAPVRIDFDAPCEDAAHAGAATKRGMAPCLASLAAALLGCRTMRIRLEFLDHDVRTHDVAFVTPITAAATVHAAMMRTLRAAAWPAPLVAIDIAVVDVAELPAGQLTLFEDDGATAAADEDVASDELTRQLTARHRAMFFRAPPHEPTHPVHERRFGGPTMEHTIDVRVDESGRPTQFQWRGRTHAIEHIEEMRRIDIDWWSDAGEASFRYVRLITRSGMLCELRCDLHTQEWALVHVYD
jgi:nucleotidyltransferase/DNA polymerase involved in DNA repair